MADGDATACRALSTGPRSMNRTRTGCCEAFSAIFVCSVTGPPPVCTVLPSIFARRSGTEPASSCATFRSSASCAGIAAAGHIAGMAGVGLSRAAAHPSTISRMADVPSRGASGVARSRGSRGPTPTPGATAVRLAAYMKSSPAPAAFAGAGPTQTITGTFASKMRFASSTAGWSSVPALSSWITTVDPSASAFASSSSR